MTTNEVLQQYVLLITMPALEPGDFGGWALTNARVTADLPAMLEAVEEDLTDLLPDGYRAIIKEGDSEEDPHSL